MEKDLATAIQNLQKEREGQHHSRAEYIIISDDLSRILPDGGIEYAALDSPEQLQAFWRAAYGSDVPLQSNHFPDIQFLYQDFLERCLINARLLVPLLKADISNIEQHQIDAIRQELSTFSGFAQVPLGMVYATKHFAPFAQRVGRHLYSDIETGIASFIPELLRHDIPFLGDMTTGNANISDAEKIRFIMQGYQCFYHSYARMPYLKTYRQAPEQAFVEEGFPPVDIAHWTHTALHYFCTPGNSVGLPKAVGTQFSVQDTIAPSFSVGFTISATLITAIFNIIKNIFQHHERNDKEQVLELGVNISKAQIRSGSYCMVQIADNAGGLDVNGIMNNLFQSLAPPNAPETRKRIADLLKHPLDHRTKSSLVGWLEGKNDMITPLMLSQIYDLARQFYEINNSLDAKEFRAGGIGFSSMDFLINSLRGAFGLLEWCNEKGQRGMGFRIAVPLDNASFDARDVMQELPWNVPGGKIVS